MKKAVGGEEKVESVSITRPKFGRGDFRLVGTAPYVQHRFGQKALRMIQERQEEGGLRARNRKRDARDFEGEHAAGMHVTAKGLPGIPAPAFRNGMISACRLCGFAMTRAKLSIFVEADDFDREDGTPLVLIRGVLRPVTILPTRNQTGVTDLRARPMWEPGWRCVLRLRWDAEQFSVTDVANLMLRVGQQVGIGEGRPDSPKSNGMGWGLFDLATGEEEEEKAA